MDHRPLIVLASLLGSAAAGCHVAGCRPGDLECAMLSQGSSSGEGSSSSSSGEVTTSTSEESSGSSSSSSGTTEVGPQCGNGIVEDGEQCDDGNVDNTDQCSNKCFAAFCGDEIVQLGFEECDDGDEDNSDSCVEGCKFARCGDGFHRVGVEACDAGEANDDEAYDGCTTTCTLGPRCGDGKVNGPEECDDKNTDDNDGCLTGCLEARSCLVVKQLVPTATSGVYRIWPEALGGETSVLVWCDMETDGGGYTFLKVDVQAGGQSDKGAAAAEAVCQTYGMRLLATRSAGHVAASYQVATNVNVQPVGGGQVKSGVDYLAMLAIYPKFMGAQCGGKGLNSADCPDWRATDDKAYWVTDVAVPGQPDTDHCLGCSMLYKWNLDGTLKSYTTIGFGEGASSYRFLCDIGDKLP